MNCLVFISLFSFCFANSDGPNKVQLKTESSQIYGAVRSAILNPGQPPLQKPAEDGKFHEGDMIIKQLKGGIKPTDRNAVIDKNLLWPDGRVYYTFAQNLPDSHREAIHQAMSDYHKYTCIQFHERTNEPDYIQIQYEGGCASFIGHQGDMQELFFGKNCDNKGTAIHELMHALGFDHEQNRNDREKYITVLTEHVADDARNNFEKSGARFTTFNLPYDYNSVMHYGRSFFSKDGHETILPNDPNADIGQRLGFSINDVKKINTLYSCDTAKLENYAGNSIKEGLNKQINFSSAEINTTLNKLNSMRKANNASDMSKLTWNTEIAETAKEHVKTCAFGTKQDTCGIANYSQLGQVSTYFSSPYTDAGKLIEEMLSMYEAQGKSYTPGSDKCGTESCYGYRQIIWAASKEIGCGIAQCGGLKNTSLKPTDLIYYVSCFFGSAGNIAGEKPFKVGFNCSACAPGLTCENGLCAGKATCSDAAGVKQCASWVSYYNQKKMNLCATCVNTTQANQYYSFMKQNCGNYCKMC